MLRTPRTQAWVWAIGVACLVALVSAVPTASTHGVAPRAAEGSFTVAPAHPPAPGIHIIIPKPGWINVTSPTSGASPPAVYGASSSYDPVDHETVLFGGWSILGGVYTNQTWVFENGTWVNETDPQASPPARAYAAMDFDANMGGDLLFGGEGVNGDLNDTWLFQGGVWTNLTADYGVAPPAEYGGVMAFDPQEPENGSVLFGGYSPYTSTGYLNTTWIWQGGAGWVPLTSSSVAPPELIAPSIAYDAEDGYLLLFGGLQSTLADSDQTWELYSGEWWAAYPTTSPAARSYASMVYAPNLGGVLLFGGYSYETGGDLSNTWIWSDGSWTEQAVSPAPGGRDSAAMALDGTGSTAILVGGVNESDSNYFAYNDTWAYEFGPDAVLSSSTASAEVGESVTFTASTALGTPPYQVEYAFGDGSFARASGSEEEINATHVFNEAGDYNATVEVTDSVGANTSAGPVEVVVHARPIASASATPSTVDAGFPVQFTGTASGGTPAFTYRWDFGDGSNATTVNATHTFAAPGTYDVRFNATDADQSTATGTVVVTVEPDPTLSLAATTTTPKQAQPITLFANVTGGTGPFNYSWSFGDGSPGSHVPAPDHDFAATGTYTVQVWVNDSGGGSTHQSLEVSVGSSRSSSSSSGAAPLWFWAGIGALVAVLVLGSVLLARRGKSR